MRRNLLLVFGLVLAALMASAGLGHAQTPPAPSVQEPAQAQPAQDAGQAAGQVPASKTQIQELIDTLEDESERQDLIGKLQSLLAARGEPTEEAGPVTADAIGWLLAEISARTDVIREAAQSVTTALDRVPDLIEWLQIRMLDPSTRAVWLWVGLRLLTVLGVGVVGLVIASLLLRPVRSSLEPGEPVGVLVRLPRVMLWLVIELLPVAAFTLAAYVALTVLEIRDLTWRVMLPLINAVIIVRTGVALIKVAFAAKTPALRLLPMSDLSARYVTRWSRRLLATATYGYAALLAAWHLNLPWALFGLLLHVLVLSIVAMLVVVILQSRGPVAAAIGRLEDEPHSAALRWLPWRSLAGIWHVLTLLYVFFIFLVWALRVPGGFRTLLEATAGSVLIMLAGWLGWRALDHVLKREVEVAEEAAERLMSGLERRVRRYRPGLGALARGLLVLFVVLGLLEVWGLGALSWLFSESGKTVIGHVLIVSAIVVTTIAVWELTSLLIERSMTEEDEEGELKLSNRARTLLNITRNFVLVFLSVIALFLILSELGLNIAPLLAGAGVIGLAIGFGSQKLVQDIITGMFVLLGDTIRVGDVVEVAGRSGVVEQMTMRTVALRDLAGAVHTIPYSSIDTVMNYTKDFSYALLDMGVAYRENVDEVLEALRQLGEEMNRDPQFRRSILEPLEILGVDGFSGSAVVIKMRFKTRPLKQWQVGREFRRRIKNRFDQLGIEIPHPHQTVYFGADTQGRAMPARLELMQAGAVPSSTGAATEEPEAQPAQRVVAQSRGG